MEFDHFKMQAGLPSFVLSPGQWIEKTNAKGIVVKLGKYGGTYAHKDIAFEFGAAISAVFRLFLIKEFQRLKENEQKQQSLEWSLQRTLSKINYRIHTDAIKEKLIPLELTKEQILSAYANEADLLNVALFGKTASQWRKENPQASGNIRDNATLEQLVVLSNMESINALLIRQNMPSQERIKQLLFYQIKFKPISLYCFIRLSLLISTKLLAIACQINILSKGSLCLVLTK